MGMCTNFKKFGKRGKMKKLIKGVWRADVKRIKFFFVQILKIHYSSLILLVFKKKSLLSKSDSKTADFAEIKFGISLWTIEIASIALQVVDRVGVGRKRNTNYKERMIRIQCFKFIFNWNELDINHTRRNQWSDFMMKKIINTLNY